MKMKLHSKKILAREFLILTLVLIIGIISFLLTYPYNSFKTSKEKTIVTEIATKSYQLDSLNSSDHNTKYLITIDERPFKILREFDSTEGRHLSYAELKKLIAKSKGRKSYFDEFNKKMKFKDFDEFEDVIQTDESRENLKIIKNQNDSVKTLKVIALRQELNKLNNNKNAVSKSILTKQEQYQFAFWTMIFSAVILILLRLTFYGVSWSISTLRRKDNGNN